MVLALRKQRRLSEVGKEAVSVFIKELCLVFMPLPPSFEYGLFDR
jgi:hypothetical protein